MPTDSDAFAFWQVIQQARDWALAHRRVPDAYREYVKLGAATCYHARLCLGMTMREIDAAAERHARAMLAAKGRPPDVR